MNASEVNLFSPEYLADPYPFLKVLREQDPVHFIELAGAWILTRHSDVHAAFRNEDLVSDWEQFQVNRMSVVGVDVSNDPYLKMSKETVLGLHGERQKTLKRLLIPFFSPAKMEELRGFVERATNESLDRIIAKGAADLAGEYIHPVPLSLISGLLGVPAEDKPLIQKWINDWGLVLEFPPLSEDQRENANTATIELENYFTDLFEKNKRKPIPEFDLAAALIESNQQLDEPFTMYQVICNLIGLYFGGQDTQVRMTGNWLVALQENPDQKAYIMEDIDRIWSCSSELFRYDTVGQMTARIASKDMVIGGKEISKGQTVMMCMASANRDSEKFDNGDVLDLQRPGVEDNRREIVTFGGGKHMCLGHNLAHITVPTMVTTLLKRCPNVQIDVDNAVRNPSISTRGFITLPATW